MAASLNLPFLSPLSFSPPIPVESHQSKLLEPMFSLIIFLTLSLISVSILIFSLHRRLKKTEHTTSDSIIECPLSKFVDKTKITHESKLTHLSNSLLLEILPSKSPKWVDPDTNGSSTVDSDCEKKKKKKRKGKKKKKVEEGVEGRSEKEKQEELVCLYPFTSSSSATQRKIKQHYDQLVKSHESNGLTLAQLHLRSVCLVQLRDPSSSSEVVGEFVNCLIEARNDLKHKSEIIQRKFTITKALLLKADRSSFDRLCQQIHKLELEQKRLEEDAFVYNWLQQQLKLSPAYKKMLEIGACMELKAKSTELVESADAEFADISFEELLAQEKKDSFWQKNGKPRTCSG